ncbi:hypothetical protein ABPG75_004501 [Micractinium tetrahymenae]
MATLEEQKKLLIPFVQRAQEVEKAEPKIAYYCRMYALEQGLELRRDVRAPEITALLEALMGKLEKDRAVVLLGNKAEDAAYCEQFALTVFNRADRVDRAGRADKATAMTFYAASYFMEILRHFGEPPPDIQQKQKYAAWRAAEISKAVKEGRKPDPPPAAGQAALDVEAALLEELAKLEAGGTSSAPSASSAGPSRTPSSVAPSGFPPSGSTAPGSTPSSDSPYGGSAAGPPADGWAPPPPPPALPPVPPAGSAGAPGSPDSPELRLPSPPKQRPIESQRSGMVWVPPPPRRFQPFQKVLVHVEGTPGPVRGTVAKVEEGTHPDHPTYLVALPDHIATISDAATLAPALTTGEAVMYHGPSGQSVEATVAEMDMSHWPPSYLVRLADGNYVDTTDDRLRQLNVPRPRSEPSSLDSLPSGSLPTGAFSAPPPPLTPPSAPPAAGGGLYPPPATGVPPPPPASSPSRAPPADRHGPSAPAAPAAAAAAPPAAPAAPAAYAAVPQPLAGYEPGLREITDASKLTKSATSALQFEDVRTAVKLLTEALTLLTQPPRQ